VAGAPSPSPSRHETVLPDEQPEAIDSLQRALGAGDAGARRRALQRIVATNPAFLDGWARLSELSLAEGDAVAAYAYARVAYHRGLDRLRREGWGGTGLVRWAQPSNRGFLRGLRALLSAAAALGEEDEAVRCREFLLDLDPGDGLGAAAYPEVPGPGWVPPPID
jgi:hypothetical protein